MVHDKCLASDAVTHLSARAPGPGARMCCDEWHRADSPWGCSFPARSNRVRAVRLLLNILWFVLAGLWMALGYLLAAVICFVLIITIPFGLASLRIAAFALWP